MREVAVVGGGITGLATAWFLRQAAPDVAVTLYEASDRLGGKIRTGRLGRDIAEEGPDTFLARVPWAVELCQQIGLADELVAPATGKAYLWTRGRMRPLPPGTILGVPYRLGPLARTGIVSPAGLGRAAADRVLPRRRWSGGDPSIDEVVRGRFGREVAERLVEPLLGGIHAGRADGLSLRSVAPRVADAAAANRSLMAGLRRSREQGTGPVFLAVRGGMARLVERLAADLKDVDIRLGASVPSLDTLGTDRAVLTVPADAAAALVRPVSPAAAAELDSIEYASVVTVSLAYPADSIGIDMDGSGFLVPRVDGRLMTACTWTTAKFPPASAPKNLILRASAGRAGDDRAMGLDDPVLVERLHGELVEAMGIVDPPTATRVTRWPRSFPQYAPGHGARVDRIEAALAADAPGVVLAGAAYRGLGIASCIEQADRAARAVLADAVSEPAS